MMQRKWLVSLIVCTGVFMSSLDLFIVNIAFPSIAKHFGGASLGSLSWILSAYAIVFAALLVPAGRWADAFGRKRAFLLGLGVFVIASAACALAPSVGFLVVARVVQAAGGALMLPTSLGLMLPEFGPHERHVAIGAWAATGGIAAAAGPPLGGLLVQADWRLVFLVNIPVGLLGLGFGWRLLAERREQNAARPDVLGALALIVAIGALVVAIVKGQEWGWGSAVDPRAAGRDRRAAAGHLVALGTPPGADRRAGDAARAQLRPGRRARRCCSSPASARCCSPACCSSRSVWHESVLTAGLMLFPGPAMATAFSIPSARLGARFGYRLPGVVGALLFCAGQLWYITQTGDTPAYVSEYLPGIAIGGAGVGLMIPTLTGAGASELAAGALCHRRGRADDGPPDRRRARRRGARGGARHVQHRPPRTSTRPG